MKSKGSSIYREEEKNEIVEKSKNSISTSRLDPNIVLLFILFILFTVNVNIYFQIKKEEVAVVLGMHLELYLINLILEYEY